VLLSKIGLLPDFDENDRGTAAIRFPLRAKSALRVGTSMCQTSARDDTGKIGHPARL